MLRLVTKPALDLGQYMSRRELMAYEQHLARQAYAYGVDLRRSAWLDHSTLGEPMMRAVDRRWNALTDDLAATALQPASRTAPTEVLEEMLRLLKLLRAPLPSVRLLRPGLSEGQWPLLTPLGTTKGGSHWLVIDLERLMALPPTHRTFMLGANLGNLHCDHGPIFAAHLLMHRRGRGLGLVRGLLRPWSRVSVFSADRAGLLSVGDLKVALEALRAHNDPGVSWYPELPPAATRVQALEDFDQSRVMTRLRLTYKESENWIISPRIQQLYAQQEALRKQQQAEEEAKAGAKNRKRDRDAKAEANGDAAKGDAKADAKGEAKRDATKGDAKADATDADANGEDEPIDEELLARVREIEEALKRAWSLARCDTRLTRRLGIL
jgi:hypothetical protein